jgi:hypothetical protein
LVFLVRERVCKGEEDFIVFELEEVLEGELEEILSFVL